MVKINKKGAVKSPKDFFGTLFSFSIKGKKGMEMSLNLIIMLIIGMVILGLVVAFVNSMMQKGTEGFDKEFEKTKETNLEQIKNCPDNFCVSPISMTVKKGKKAPIYVKLRATSGPLDCAPGAQPASSCPVDLLFTPETTGAIVSGFVVSSGGFSILDGEEEAVMYTLSVPSNQELGIYFLTFTLTDGAGDTYKKSITLTVE